MKLGNYLCPTNFDTNHFIGNQEFDNSFNVTSVLIAKCSNSSTNGGCKSIEDIDRVITNLRTNFVFLNSNYDPSL